MDDVWVQIIVAVITAILGGLVIKIAITLNKNKKRSSSKLNVNKGIKQNYLGDNGKNEVNINGVSENYKNETKQ
jgi:hypothetical protein